MRSLVAGAALALVSALLVLSPHAASRAAAPDPAAGGPGGPAAAAPAAPAAATRPALPKGPVLTDESGRPIVGVRLAKADVRAVVDGSLAQTTMTLTFANDQGRVLGGELVFPLPEGVTVSGYGLDVNGVMVDGVAVEKQRARIIYEQELHKRVDPGLVEHVAGNAFRTRVYPVPPNGTRTVKVEYVTDVQAGGGPAGAGVADGKAVLHLPVNWAEVTETVNVRIEVRNAAAAPVIAGPAGDQPGLKATKDGNHQVLAGAIATKALAADGLAVVLPPLPERAVSVERRLKTARTFDEWDDQRKAANPFDQFEHYFVVSHAPAAANNAARKGIELNGRPVGVVWDASLSRAEGDREREVKLLAALLDKLGNPAVDVIVLRNDVEVLPAFAGGKEGSAKVVEAIRGLAYDGATNFGALRLPKNSAGHEGRRAAEEQERQPDYGLYLMFTDGLGNLGADAPARADVPVYAISNDEQVNHAMLRSLSQQSGGAYFNLKRAADAEVLAGVGDAPFAFVSAEFKADEVADVYPPPGTAVHGRFTLAGRLLANQATVKVNYGYGKDVAFSETFTIQAGGAPEGTLLPRYWAQQRVAALSLDAERNRDELEKVGKQFNLVTPNTSLLVLETVDQYVQYRVVPPKNRPDVYAAFVARIEQHKAQEEQTREQKVQQVLAMWNGRVQWWEKEYTYPKDLRVQPQETKGGAGGAVAAGADGPVPATSPASPIRTGAAAPAPRPVAAAGDVAVADPVAPAALPAPTPAPAPAAEPPSPAGAAAAGPAPAAPASRAPAESRAEPAQQAQGGQQPGRPQGPQQPGQPPADAARTETRVYDVRDLVVQTPDFTDAPDFNLQRNGERSRTGSSGGGSGGGLFAGGEGRGRAGGNGGRGTESDRAVDGLSRSDAAKAQADGGAADESTARITIKPWDPNTPYLKAMKDAGADGAYAAYLEQRKAFGKSPAFYLDCADFLVNAGRRALGVRVLTNVAELRLEDARLIRVAAHRAGQIGDRELAIDLFEKVAKLRPEEPQSHRDLALALADRADALLGDPSRPADAPPADAAAGSDAGSRAKADYARALDLLNKVVVGTWPRFPEVELPVLMEANRIAARAASFPNLGEVPNPIDARLRKNLDLGVRIVLTWDADQTDIDLWVTEPSGEKCFYGHNRTVIGGLISRDYTDAYGPEEYCLRKLMPGEYKIQANYYGSRQQELTGPATVQATVITNFGRPDERRQALTVRLKNAREIVDIGTVNLGGTTDAGK